MANPHQNTRGGGGRYIRSPETAARDAQAAELRAQGHTLQQIADELGYANKSSASAAVKRAIREVIHGPAEKLLALHIDRLEHLYNAAMDVLEADHVVVSHGKIIKDDNGMPLVDNGSKLAAIREARASLESFRKLTGLDRPAKVEHTSTGVSDLLAAAMDADADRS